MSPARDLASFGISPARAFSVAVFLLISLVGQDGTAGEPPAFQREWLEPYLRGAIGVRARGHLQARAPLKAIPLLRRLQRSAEGIQARYLLGHALLAASQPAAAADLFAKLGQDYSLLGDYCRYHEAQGRFRAGDFAGAEAAAAAVPRSSVLRLEADLLRADALRALGRWSELPPIWRDYLRQHPKGGRAGQAHLVIGQALEQEAAATSDRGRKTKLLEEALEHYRQAVIRAPLAASFTEASRRLGALAARLPDGKLRAELSGWDLFEQAQAYFRAQRNAESEAAFAALSAGKDASALLRCKATFFQAKSIFKQRQRARSAPVYEQAVAACRKAGEGELVVKSLFDGAKGLMHARQHKDAITRLLTIEKEFPSHSFADDARLWAAEAYETLKQPAEVTRLLESIPGLYPTGDMAHEALWRLARSAYLARKPEAALKYLDQAVALGRPRYYYSAGQALYWRARILEQTGKLRDSRETYRRCIEDYPLSYYALLSFNRLREGHPAIYRTSFRSLLAPVGTRAGRWTFPRSAIFGETSFLRGVELARLGFGDAAAQELARAGLSPRRTSASTSGDELWLGAVIYDRAGLWQLSHALPRDADPQLRRSYPLAEAWRRWALLYPQAYAAEVRAAARAAAIPEELVLSIMREESGFSPGIESYANAIGLMQLILPTARAAGALNKLPVTRDLLRDPSVNIRLGATFLGFLVSTFQRQLPLAVAGYNAGEGGVFRWLTQFGNTPLDEFIERIPYDQTRRYTKRVLSTLFTYSVLYRRGDAKLPRLSQKIPAVTRRAFGSR